MDVKALIQKQSAMLEERLKTPLEVEVLLGGRVVTVVMPLMRPTKFFDFVTAFPATSVQEVRTYGFALDDAARNYPGIVIRDGEDEDNLSTVAVDGDGKQQIRYGWPEVYGLLEHEDRQSIRALIWGEYWYRPQREKQAAAVPPESVSSVPESVEE